MRRTQRYTKLWIVNNVLTFELLYHVICILYFITYYLARIAMPKGLYFTAVVFLLLFIRRLFS